jgi:hypothetical protein
VIAVIGLVLATIRVAPIRAGDQVELKKVMNGIASGLRPRVAFVEEKRSALLKRPIVIEGELLFEPPDMLQRLVFTPNEEKLLIEGDNLSLVRPGRELQTLDLRNEPAVYALVEAFRGALSGDLERLKRHYSVAFSGAEADWRLELVPRLDSMAKAVKVMQIKGHEAGIDTITIRRTDGDSTITRLRPLDE